MIIAFMSSAHSKHVLIYQVRKMFQLNNAIDFLNFLDLMIEKVIDSLLLLHPRDWHSFLAGLQLLQTLQSLSHL